MLRVCKIKYFNIYSNGNDEYIIHNTHKKFENGHTHIKKYNTAKYITYLALNKKMPKKNHLSNYLYESIIRISTDKEYIRNIQKLKK